MASLPMRKACSFQRGREAGTRLLFVALTVFSPLLPAAEYFVSPAGSDTQPGTSEQPFRTIQRAADVMQAGDTCTIRAGLYREWVKPPRGGESEQRPITYRAAPGERVMVRGSERVDAWQRAQGDVWKVELPDAFFGDFHPYRLKLSGDWLHYGKEFHLGAIHQDGASLREKLTAEEVSATPGSYRVEEGEGSVVLHARFAGGDPNQTLVEINVRECVFFPLVKGLRHVVVDGIWFEHASANWAAWRSAQRGAVGTNWGYRWTIRDCRVSDVRCVGIVCGNDASSENTGFDLGSVGSHHILRNHILRCGQAGIHGFKGWGGSVIEGNLIEDINVHKEFGGEETAGIKIHSPVEITVRDNIVRRVHSRRVPGRNNDFVAIWIDWAGQGTRVTGNVVYDNDPDTWALYLQNNHGSPILVDHNIFSGTIASNSSGCVFAHNWFDRCRWNFLKPYALVAYWKPHTAELAGCKVITYGNDRHWNNVFTGGGLEKLPEGPGVSADWNVFLNGARPSAWADSRSVTLAEAGGGAEFVSRPDGVDVRLPLPEAARGMDCPVVTPRRVGVFALTGQGLETPDGKPLTLDRDRAGVVREGGTTVAGPFVAAPPDGIFRLRAGPRSGSR